MSSLLVHCDGEKTHFSRNEKNVFVKPNEQCRTFSYIVMARIGNRQHGALGEVEKQNALLKQNEKNVLLPSTCPMYIVCIYIKIVGLCFNIWRNI